MKLESIVHYLDGYLDTAEHPDYRNALNGLQVAGAHDRAVRSLAAAVDLSEATIAGAVDARADLLVVHHGLFWPGLRPVTGRTYRKLKALVDADLAVYSAHLPLDAHPEVGNGALLAGALGLDELDPFGTYQGAHVGWCGALEHPMAPEQLRDRVGEAVGGHRVTHLAGGPDLISRVGVVTGAGGSFLETAAEVGLDALVTGEASHHTYVDALELGVHVFLAGHYATETFGVRALCQHLADRFDLSWTFIDDPSGL